MTMVHHDQFIIIWSGYYYIKLLDNHECADNGVLCVSHL